MDIQVGDRVTYKSTDNEERQVIMTNLEQIDNYKNSGLILKIERPKYEVVEEKKELLTTEEKEFLKQYIKIINRLNNGKIISIRKQSSWITLKLKTELEYEAEIGSNFKNLEVCKTYTLQELGLEEK